MNDTALYSKNLDKMGVTTVLNAWMATTPEGKLFESFLLVEHGSAWLEQSIDCFFRLSPPEKWTFASLVDFLAAGSGWDEQMMVFE